MTNISYLERAKFNVPYPPSKRYGSTIGLALTCCIIEMLLQEKASNTD